MTEGTNKKTNCTETGSWGISRHNVSGTGKQVKQLIPIWPGTFVWLLVGAFYIIYKAFNWDSLINP